jgi:hypothetical protein
MSNPGPALLRTLIAEAQQDPAVAGLWVGGSALSAPDEPFLTLELIYAASALPLVEGEGIALSRLVDGALQVVTADGLDFTIRLLAPGEVPAPAFRQVKRPPAGPSGEVGAPAPDLAAYLAALNGAFWGDLYRATAAIGQGEAFTAHGYLERCRGALLALYRLAAGDLGAGWFRAEGALDAKLQQELAEWLVVGLNQEAQWRNAYRLAQRFESLMLPLAERVGLTYPWSMRTLAFDRIGKAKPGVTVAE